MVWGLRSWITWSVGVEHDMSKCCINGGALVCATLTSCLRERTECGRSSFLPIYPLFFESVCESVLDIVGISIDVEIKEATLADRYIIHYYCRRVVHSP